MGKCDLCDRHLERKDMAFVCKRRPSSPDTLTCVMAGCKKCLGHRMVNGCPSCDVVAVRTAKEWGEYEESDQFHKDNLLFFEIF